MVNLQYDSSGRFAIFVATGALTLKEVTEACIEWSNHPDFDPSRSVLVDASDADWHQAVQQFQLMEDAITTRVNDTWQGRKVAWVVQSQTEAALIDNHLATAGWNATWRAFVDLKNATDWLTGNGNANHHHECLSV